VKEVYSTDSELQNLLDCVLKEVVSNLLSYEHLREREEVQSALVYEDLWYENKTRKSIGESDVKEMIFDSSCCYAHSEYELSIMRMFGGFSEGFFEEYHRLILKTYPEAEYDDRLSLYEL